MARLAHIAKAEGIDLTEDGARVIARVARGGMRDAVSLLELCAGAHRTVDAALVFDTVGSGNRDSAYKIIEAVSVADYRTVYSVIDDIVMKSGDLSVFWQELIDAYRDIMVAKSIDNSREYLDLTELEYETLTKIAKGFTMARLTYHATLLEAAMADMQRAFNSKRSIAEIALTRMCDPRLSSTSESLLVRIEELEKQLSLLKLGAVQPASPQPVELEEVVEELPASTVPSLEQNSVSPITKSASDSEERPYSEWGEALERIGAIKVSLSAQFLRSTVTKCANTFNIRMSDFFAKKFASSDADIAIVRGILAELEGIPQDSVKIKIYSLSAPESDLSKELENALK